MWRMGRRLGKRSVVATTCGLNRASSSGFVLGKEQEGCGPGFKLAME